MSGSGTTHPPIGTRPVHRLAFGGYRVVWHTVLLCALLQTAYGAAFIWRTSFVVEGQRYFCLLDDAMISMRYAHNWALGSGLVWNAGERVEGYTNFGWTGLLTLCHLFHLSPMHTCLLVQVLGIVTLWGCLVATARLAHACRLLPAAAICAVILAAACYYLPYFSLFGMEVGALYLVYTLALTGCVRAARRRDGRVGTLLWFVPAVLIRMDSLLVAVYAYGTLLLLIRRHYARLTLGLFFVLALMGIHVLWRHQYYGLWWPNTYYLKLTGWPLAERLETGLDHALWTAATLGMPVLLALPTLLAPKRWHALLWGPFVTAIAYQTYVGGDATPLSRFVVPTTAGLFVLAAQGTQQLMALFNALRTRALGALARAGFTLACLCAMNAIHWDHCIFVVPPQTTYGNRMNVRLWRAIERVADPDATLAVSWAGAVPYFSQRQCCDILGKCDAHIARLPAVRGVARAGHNKFDIGYTLTRYKPDIVLHAYAPREPAFARCYHPAVVTIDGAPLAFFVRNGTPHVRRTASISWNDAGRIIHAMNTQ